MTKNNIFNQFTYAASVFFLLLLINVNGEILVLDIFPAIICLIVGFFYGMIFRRFEIYKYVKIANLIIGISLGIVLFQDFNLQERDLLFYLFNYVIILTSLITVIMNRVKHDPIYMVSLFPNIIYFSLFIGVWDLNTIDGLEYLPHISLIFVFNFNKSDKEFFKKNSFRKVVKQEVFTDTYEVIGIKNDLFMLVKHDMRIRTMKKEKDYTFTVYQNDFYKLNENDMLEFLRVGKLYARYEGEYRNRGRGIKLMLSAWLIMNYIVHVSVVGVSLLLTVLYIASQTRNKKHFDSYLGKELRKSGVSINKYIMIVNKFGGRVSEKRKNRIQEKYNEQLR